MKLIIDIPDKYLNNNSGIIDATLFTGENNIITDVSIEDEYAKFQILPKGHGDLIDRDVAYKEYDKACLSWEGGLLKYVPTVIPAERGDNNGSN